MDKYKFAIREGYKIVLLIIVGSAVFTGALLIDSRKLLDNYCVQYAELNYAYVGTLYHSEKSDSLFNAIDGSVITDIEESEYVDKVDYRITKSVIIDDIENVPCFFFRPQINQLIFFRGQVQRVLESKEWDPIRQNICSVSVSNIYAGQSNWINKNDIVNVSIIESLVDSGENIILEENQEYLFLCIPTMSDVSGILDNTLFAFNLPQNLAVSFEGGAWGKINNIYTSGVTSVPNVESDEVKDSYCKERLVQLDLDGYMREISMWDHAFTARSVSDMSLLPAIVEEKMYVSEGRELNANDVGKRVCVISKVLAEMEGLDVHDILDISLGNDCFHIDGYETGVPRPQEEKRISYASPIPFEIVGIYSYSNYQPDSISQLFNYNDIFIPAEDMAMSISYIYPYSLSIRILAKNMENFMDTIGVELAQAGYILTFTDSKWGEVETVYKGLIFQLWQLGISSWLIKVAGALLLSLIIIRLYKYEAIVRFIHGETCGELMRMYLIRIIIIIPICCIMSLIIGAYCYSKECLILLDTFKGLQLPTISSLLGLISKVNLQMIMMILMLLGYACLSKRKSVIRYLQSI